MAPDLTDREAALLARKSVRTVQRWCQSGRLPGAYKAGRSWRIPRHSLRAAGLGALIGRDETETLLRHASAACRELAADLEVLRADADHLVMTPASLPRRNWRRLARLLAELERELDGLPRFAAAVPERYSSF